MSRAIKFRAWNPKDKHMITQNYRTNNEVLIESRIHDWVVMQYTGLKDKNGKEIYEGDIVKKLAKPSGGEYYGGEDFIEVICPISCKAPSFVFETSSHWLPVNSSCEIIGNIYENKELLD